MMDLVDTLPVVRYWSEVLLSTIMTHLHDLGVKVMEVGHLDSILQVKFLVKVLAHLS